MTLQNDGVRANELTKKWRHPGGTFLGYCADCINADSSMAQYERAVWQASRTPHKDHGAKASVPSTSDTLLSRCYSSANVYAPWRAIRHAT